MNRYLTGLRTAERVCTSVVSLPYSSTLHLCDASLQEKEMSGRLRVLRAKILRPTVPFPIPNILIQRQRSNCYSYDSDHRGSQPKIESCQSNQVKLPLAQRPPHFGGGIAVIMRTWRPPRRWREDSRRPPFSTPNLADLPAH